MSPNWALNMASGVLGKYIVNELVENVVETRYLWLYILSSYK